MKKTILSVVALTAVLALMTSCVKSDEIHDKDAYTYRFEIAGENDADAKSVLNDKFLAWELNDVLAFVLEDDNTIINYNTTIVDVMDPRPSFGFTIDTQLGAGDRICCCYPRIGDTKREQGYTAAVQHITIPLIQTHKSGKFAGKNMPMVSVPFTFTSDMLVGSNNQLGQIKFLNLGAMLDFKVFSSDAAHQGEVVWDVIFEADKNIGGAFGINLQNVDPADEATLAIDLTTPVWNDRGAQPQSNMIRTESDAVVGTSKDDAGSVRMVVAPGTYTGKVKVRTNNAYYVFNVTETKKFARNGYYPLGLDLTKADYTVSVRRNPDKSWWYERFINSINYDNRERLMHDGNLNSIWINPWFSALASEEKDGYDYTYSNVKWNTWVAGGRRDVPDIVYVIGLGTSYKIVRIGIGKANLDWPYNHDLKECEFFTLDTWAEFKPLQNGGNWENYQTANDGNDWKHIVTATDIPKEDGIYWYDVPAEVSDGDRTGSFLKIRPTKVYRGPEACEIAEIYLDVI